MTTIDIFTNTHCTERKIMFNISNKQKMINYFSKIYAWQNNQNNKIDFYLSTYDYPIYLLSFNELFSTVSESDIINNFDAVNDLDNMEKEINQIINTLNLNEIFNEDFDLSLKMDRFSENLTYFKFHEYNNEWFCIIKEKETTYINLIGSSHRDFNLSTYNTVRDFIYNLKSLQQSSASSE